MSVGNRNLIVLCCLFLLGTGTCDECIDDTICTCINRSINCACNITINATDFHIDLPQKFPEPPLILTVKDCPKVTIKSHGVMIDPPKEIHIADVGHLEFQTSAFGGNNNAIIKQLTISNSYIKELPENAFSNVSDIQNIEFRHLTIGKISSNAFQNLANLTSFLIIDSSIGIISSGAFNNLQHVQDFLIKNSTIVKLDKDAIKGTNVHQFILHETSIKEWKSHAITLNNVTNVAIKQCKVETMYDRSISINISRELIFYDNRIRKLKSGAMHGLFNATKITFNNNVIEMAENNSMDILLLQTFAERKCDLFQMLNNSYPCEDAMCALLKDMTERLDLDMNWTSSTLQHNYCYKKIMSLENLYNNRTTVCKEEVETNTKNERSGGEDGNNENTHHMKTSTTASSHSSAINLNYYFCSLILLLSIFVQFSVY